MRKLILGFLIITAILYTGTILNSKLQNLKQYDRAIIESYIESINKQLISKEVQQNTVSIFGEGGESSFCSGVLIAENETNSFVVTCKHCISPNEETLVEDNEVLYTITSVGDDLALFIVKGKIHNKKPAKLANKKPIRNQELIHIGYPSFQLYERWGRVLRTTKDWQYISLQAIGGCSGGGVYNRDKELVGILWGAFPGKNISIYDPINDIKLFLDNILRSFQ